MKKSRKKVEEAADRVVDETATVPECEVTNSANTHEEVTEQFQSVADERLPGVLEKTSEEDGSEGEDEQEEEKRTFKTIARSLEELPINAITHFQLIPDFVTPTEAECPIIVRTPDGLFCIEAWSRIESAQAEEKTSIICEVDDLDVHSEEEICLRKAGIRTLTRGGISTYAESVRNASDLLAMLLSSDEDLKMYGHGQRRYGEGFINNPEQDVRHVLTMRLDRDRDTINFYIKHGEYLSQEALNTLIDRRAPKDFFVKVQVRKGIAVKNLKSRNILATSRITQEISAFILEEFEKFLAERDARTNGHIPEPAQTQTDNGTEPNAAEDNTPSSDSDEENEANDEYLRDEEELPAITPEINPEEPVTIETIRTGALDISRRLAEHISKDVPLVEIENRLTAELHNIAKLLTMIAFLNNKGK